MSDLSLSNDRMPGDATPRAVLLGVAGAGKTTAGRMAADLLGVPLIEVDDLVEQATHQSVADLVVMQDSRLPDLLTEATLRALRPGGEAEGAIVTLGASVPTYPQVPPAIQGARAHGTVVIELAADLGTIASRNGLNAPRSLALGQPRRLLARMAAELEAAYGPLVDQRIDTTHMSPDEVARAIVAAV